MLDSIMADRVRSDGDFCSAVSCHNARYKHSCSKKSFFKFPREEDRYVYTCKVVHIQYTTLNTTTVNTSNAYYVTFLPAPTSIVIYSYLASNG